MTAGRNLMFSGSHGVLFASGIRSLVALSVTIPAMAFGQVQGITDLGTLNNGLSSLATSVSGNGEVVAGYSLDQRGVSVAFRWTPSGGMASLGVLPGYTSSEALGVSADGSVIVGTSVDLTGTGRFTAFRWTQAVGMIGIGDPNGHSLSVATGVNSNGSVIVGYLYDNTALTKAFRWTESAGMVRLGVLNGGIASAAAAVSGDGSVVVGSAADGTANQFSRAFRWTEQTGMVNLGVHPGGSYSFGNAVSGDGTVVVGYGNGTVVGGNANADLAFRWTQAGGMVNLGTLAGGWYSAAFGVSGSGDVVVGMAADGPIGRYNNRAFRWSQTTGIQTVEHWLRDNGVSVPADITFKATAANNDGSVIVGQLQNESAFIARVSPIGSGMITLEDLQTSLVSATNAVPQAASLGSTVLHGAHSRPLAHRVAAGKSCVWTAGDVGRDDHGGRAGVFGLAEVGGCHRFTPGLQGALSVGVSGSKQDLTFNGHSDVRTRYGVAEVLGKIPGTNLWPSAAFLFQQGHADARRGYVNAGAIDYSRGRPGVQTTALRLRVDWDGAARVGAVAFTPYADVSQARTRIDGYTEGGGGFPAQFNGRKEKATEVRLGSDASWALTSGVKLVGLFEGVHRFEAVGAGTSGTVLGLSSFDFPGQRPKRDWLRGGVGVDMKAGLGTLSAMLNATTQGAAPSYWMNASYGVAF